MQIGKTKGNELSVYYKWTSSFFMLAEYQIMSYTTNITWYTIDNSGLRTDILRSDETAYLRFFNNI